MAVVDVVGFAQQIDGLELDALVAKFLESATQVRFWWMRLALIAGEVRRQSRYGDRAIPAFAERVGFSTGTVDQLARISERILRPRLEAGGEAAEFLLDEQEFYRIAVRAAPRLEKPAVEVLAIAEEKRREKPKYSTQEFRRDVGLARKDEGSTRSEVKAIDRLLKKLAAFSDADADAYALHADVHDALPRVGDAFVLVERLLKGLRGREAA